jgi:hypothetical protein
VRTVRWKVKSTRSLQEDAASIATTNCSSVQRINLQRNLTREGAGVCVRVRGSTAFHHLLELFPAVRDCLPNLSSRIFSGLAPFDKVFRSG